MKPCTSTNLHEACGDNPYFYPAHESIRACREAGFTCMDLNLHSAASHSGPLAQDETWEVWVESLRDCIAETNVETPYAHAYFYLQPERTEREEELTCRTLEAAGRLGVRWTVVHPFSVCDDAWYSHRRSMEDNLRYMNKYAEIASRHGMGIALENMVEDPKKRRFSGSAEDLLELLEKLNDPVFGICWDFGHGERSGCNTAASLRMIGKQLKNVHVHDYTRNQFGFDHTIPFLGITDWKTVMPVMTEIGYEGEWNFECHNFTAKMPPELRKTALRLAYETNVRMIQMA